MSKLEKFDEIVVLGGGRIDEENLTVLSKQRLDKGAELYHQGIAPKIFALGGQRGTFSTSRQEAIFFNKSSATLRKEYLVDKSVNPEDIVEVPFGGDTIVEAFASALFAKDLEMRRILLVTADKHMPRALEMFNEAFRRVFKNEGFEIGKVEVPSGNLLDEKVEQKSLLLTREFFRSLLDESVITTKDLDGWHDRHRNFYEQLGMIQRPPGKKVSQAYAGLKETNCGRRPDP